ncbi:mitochondrial aldehyde dehydrogenase [Rhinocladiella similis]
MAMAAKTLKNFTMETSGKSPLIVFNDDNLEQAGKWSHLGIMSSQGQICSAMSRILVHHDVYDEHLSNSKEGITTISKVGDQLDEAIYRGPQISNAQCHRILSYAEAGKDERATLLLGGEPHPVNDKGFPFSPTGFTEVKDSMKIYREEVFGPFVVISTTHEEDELFPVPTAPHGLGAALIGHVTEHRRAGATGERPRTLSEPQTARRSRQHKQPVFVLDCLGFRSIPRLGEGLCFRRREDGFDMTGLEETGSVAKETSRRRNVAGYLGGAGICRRARGGLADPFVDYQH